MALHEHEQGIRFIILSLGGYMLCYAIFGQAVGVLVYAGIWVGIYLWFVWFE